MRKPHKSTNGDKPDRLTQQFLAAMTAESSVVERVQVEATREQLRLPAFKTARRTLANARHVIAGLVACSLVFFLPDLLDTASSVSSVL